VLRGGSWFNFGGYCRSAFRLHGGPADRNVSDGFRLARGLEFQVRSGASRQPVGTPAAERGGHKRGTDGGAVKARNQARSSSQKDKSLLDALKENIKDIFKK
jgi:hypothetical protein